MNPEELVEVELVPVEVFGTDGDQCEHCQEHDGYGLMDAVSAWSDCNRAAGRIYRVEDPEEPRDLSDILQHSNHGKIPSPYRRPGDTIGVFIRKRDLPWLEKRHGDDFEVTS